MINKIFTLMVALFMIYALINKSNNLIPQGITVSKDKKNEIIEKIKAYTELLTADPKQASLVDKKTPLLSEGQTESPEQTTHISPLNAGVETKTPDVKANTFKSSEPVTYIQMGPTENNAIDIFQNKISNVLYNILHTTKGQELLDKILVSPSSSSQSDSKQTKYSPYQNNSILNILDGEGAEAECGDIVTVNYITRLVSGQEIENTRVAKKPKTFQIGNGDVIKGIEYALIGMKKGGLRRLVVPPRLAYNEEKFSKSLIANNEFVTMDIELMDIKPALNDWQNKIKVFQEVEEEKAIIIPCGSKVFFSCKLSDTNEHKFFSSTTPLQFTLGSSQVPGVINKAFSNITSHAQRMVMIPSSLLYKQNISFFPDNMKLPEKAMLIFEINTGYQEKNIETPQK